MTATRFPVAVIMECRPPGEGPWASEEWQLVGVVAGSAGAAGSERRTIMRADAGTTQILWRGFTLTLYADDGESYYQNLQGEQPSVFVVCRQEEDETEAVPLLATVSYDEASSYLEVDDLVFAVPMPPEVYVWLERYVVTNYVPMEKKKRKREKWKKKE